LLGDECQSCRIVTGRLPVASGDDATLRLRAEMLSLVRAGRSLEVLAQELSLVVSLGYGSCTLLPRRIGYLSAGSDARDFQGMRPMKYKIALYESDEGFAVSVPGLPGCWSQGATETEALANIQDAIRDYLAALDSLLDAENVQVREVEVAA
jgi:predicted RNase H-like HicB family nuclease